MSKLLKLPNAMRERELHGIFDDFYWFVTAHAWVKTVADVASGNGIIPTDAANGILTMAVEDATDNDEIYLESAQETFLFANNKPIVFETRVQYAEANTDDANIFLGLMNAVGADSLVDNGAGPKTNFSGFGFFKVDGGTNWKIITSLGTTQTSVELTAANSRDKIAKTAGGASYSVFRIEWTPYSATNGVADFFIDEVHVYSQDFVYTSATEMQVGLGVKNGGATAETMLVDYVAAFQVR